MLSKRSKLFTLAFILLFMLSCNIDGNSTPDPDPNLLVEIPKSCYRDGFQIYVSVGLDYCFAYPPAYHVTLNSDRNHTTICHCNAPPSEDEIAKRLAEGDMDIAIEDIQANAQLTTSVSIDYDLRQDKPDLAIFAENHKKEAGYCGEILPTSIGSQPALLRTEVVEKHQETGIRKEVLYIFYVHNEERYYKITLQGTSLMTEQTTSGKEIERLLFLIQNTFTFIE